MDLCVNSYSSWNSCPVELSGLHSSMWETKCLWEERTLRSLLIPLSSHPLMKWSCDSVASELSWLISRSSLVWGRRAEFGADTKKFWGHNSCLHSLCFLHIFVSTSVNSIDSFSWKGEGQAGTKCLWQIRVCSSAGVLERCGVTNSVQWDILSWIRPCNECCLNVRQMAPLPDTHYSCCTEFVF